MTTNIIEISEEKIDPLEAFKRVEYPEVDREHFGDNRPDFQEYKFTLLAEENKNIVGYINVTVRLGIAYINSLLVGKSHRNKGIGKSLVLKAEEKAKTYNAHKIWLETGANWGTEKFYKDLGYSVRCKLPNDVAHIEAISMDKMLDESVVNTESKNIAYIDGQNLYMGTSKAVNSWDIDLQKFKIYLTKKYKVDKAYYFLGYVEEGYNDLYEKIQSAGFILVFRQHNSAMLGKKKGNVDSDIIFQIMKKFYKGDSFNKIVLVSGDGDYKMLVDFLIEENKLEKILFPNKKFASSLYKSLGNKYCISLDESGVRNKIEIDKIKRVP